MIARPYRPEDLLKVIEVYTTSIRTLAAPYYTQDQLLAWAPSSPNADRWRERLARLDTWVAVPVGAGEATADGRLAEFASCTDDGYLDFLFTHPNFARRGVATRLYDAVETALKSRGVGRVTTHASLAARAFFEHTGFRVEGEETVECRGVYLRRFAMAKDLGGQS